MSIECIVGVPGSGKTYKGVQLLKEVYDTKERLIFTNVTLRVDYDERLKLFDFFMKMIMVIIIMMMMIIMMLTIVIITF